MKCLRIFATPDGESHLGEVDIAMTLARSFPNEAPVEPSAYYEAWRSAYYEASRVRFVHIPPGVREAGLHNPPGRLLVIWLDGEVEFETSDGEMRRVSAGKLERQFSSRIRMGKGISRAIHRKGNMLYWLRCRTALTRLLRSRLLAHRVTAVGETNMCPNDLILRAG